MGTTTQPLPTEAEVSAKLAAEAGQAAAIGWNPALNCQGAPNLAEMKAMQEEHAARYEAEQARRTRLDIFAAILSHRPDLKPTEAADQALLVYAALK